MSVPVMQRRLRSHPVVPIPSQRWSRYAEIDDPDYRQKLAEYHKNKKPLWERYSTTKPTLVSVSRCFCGYSRLCASETSHERRRRELGMKS